LRLCVSSSPGIASRKGAKLAKGIQGSGWLARFGWCRFVVMRFLATEVFCCKSPRRLSMRRFDWLSFVVFVVMVRSVM
jgi:hypothetical protein